ncbi:MAG TPA: UvrD-helicase domain-containing protein [Candidatus Woesebacteria bacterium]|nr:UvrD-helicase domain-containing protein [Candidatus Woesebacteria bacterium]
MNIVKGLNPAQLEAVTYQGSPLLLLAGAGSGKTRVLTYRVAYFIDQKIAEPSEILLLTFTNKAANEMKQRMLKLLTTTLSQRNQLPVVFAGTFHSFCYQVLRRDGFKIGIKNNFVIYDENDQEDLVRRALIDLNLDPKEFRPASVLSFIDRAKNNYQDPLEIITQSRGFWGKYAAVIYQQYQKRLTEFGALDFNDLLFKTIDLFTKEPDVLEKYQDKFKYIFIDEYQDTNQVQYLLTKLMAEKYQQITVVGDASQAIYGWRGADYRNLTSFTRDFKDTKIINLEQNYRSTQIILEAANGVISKNSSHPVLKLFTLKQSNNLIKVYKTENEIDEAKLVAQRISFYHGQLGVPYKEIAVLYRMNAQSRVLEEIFLRAGLPYVLLGGVRFYERAEIKDILSLVRYLIDREDKIAETRCLKALGKNRFQLFFESIDHFDYQSLTSLEILEKLITFSGYLSRFDPQDEDDQKRIENINELKSVAASFSSISDFLANVTLVEQEYSEQEKLKRRENREGVRLMTLHGSKGLEFTVVFLVGFEEGILPHSRSLVDEAEIEEERRLCYVGITRAKDFLEITYTKKRLYFGKNSLNEPSRFLSDIPQRLREDNRSGDDFIYDPDIY